MTDLGSDDAECSDGGIRVSTGVDANADGTLDETEVEQTRFVCNGAAGADGSDGADGGCSAAGNAGPLSGGFLAISTLLGLMVLRRKSHNA